jgi:hypothetical protein
MRRQGASQETANASPHTTQICDISSDRSPKLRSLSNGGFKSGPWFEPTQTSQTRQSCGSAADKPGSLPAQNLERCWLPKLSALDFCELSVHTSCIRTVPTIETIKLSLRSMIGKFELDSASGSYSAPTSTPQRPFLRYEWILRSGPFCRILLLIALDPGFLGSHTTLAARTPLFDRSSRRETAPLHGRASAGRSR